VTLVAVVALKVPHVGAQEPTFGAVSVHATPELVGSFCTCAVNVTAAPPAAMVVNLLVTVTVIAGVAIVRNPYRTWCCLSPMLP